MAHDGLARAIYPSHTMGDGDTIFALATGGIETSDVSRIGALGADVMAEAILRAVRAAESIPGYPAASSGQVPSIGVSPGLESLLQLQNGCWLPQISRPRV